MLKINAKLCMLQTCEYYISIFHTGKPLINLRNYYYHLEFPSNSIEMYWRGVKNHIQSTPLNRATSGPGYFDPIKQRNLLTENMLFLEYNCIFYA